MSFLDQVCKFKIGQIVTTTVQSMVAAKHAKPNRTVSPQPMQVVERHIVNCYGGFQVSYAVRITAHPDYSSQPSVFKDLFLFTEPELMEYRAQDSQGTPS